MDGLRPTTKRGNDPATPASAEVKCEDYGTPAGSFRLCFNRSGATGYQSASNQRISGTGTITVHRVWVEACVHGFEEDICNSYTPIPQSTSPNLSTPDYEIGLTYKGRGCALLRDGGQWQSVKCTPWIQ